MTQYNTDNNMEQKSLWNFLRKYKKVGIILICIPIFLSAACYFSVPYFNQAGSSAWLSFWGGYLGSVIMAAVTLCVLEQQLCQNHFENEINRELQLNTISYQTYMGWINNLQLSLIKLNSELDLRHLNGIVDILKDNTLGEGSNNKNKILEICKVFKDKCANAGKSFEILMINIKDNEEELYFTKIKKITQSFIYLINDIEILAEYCFFLGGDNLNRSNLINKINEYKEQHLKEESYFKRIWIIVDKLNFALTEKRNEIFEELLNSVPNSIFFDTGADLIKYEMGKAQNILKNGTK